ncbi:MAG: DNA polymerase/3'-5' exonuclease PolX [Deltaproteobacteria bacterium]|nr:DNA polymerase/3'-5' exonuclease PolX [Deltaproteobacteria bacterium]NIS76491.1 DNA polymerase/3'-5' exonuclease PolX [Deltaproteobacteria bacterium]
MADNREIAEKLNLIADYLELQDENPFRIRAYRRAAESLMAHPESVEKYTERELTEIPGVGKDIAGKIGELRTGGEIPLLEELRKTVPGELLQLKKIPGLGPKKVSLFFRKLGIDSFEKLKEAIRDGTLLELPGIRAKTVENILRGMEFYEHSRQRLPLGEAYVLAEALTRQIRESGLAESVVVAGSIRRMKETIGDIDILAISESKRELVDLFTALPQVSEILAAGDTKGSVTILNMVQADMLVVPREAFGSALAYFTGSKAHNVRLRQIARKKGLKLSEYGLFREKDGTTVASKTEEEIYRQLGMEFIPPEIREDSGEVEAAIEGKLPRLVTEDMIQGEMHLHSDWSDGFHTLDEIARLMEERGFRYFCVTDHSKSLRIAGGLDENELLRQKEIIEKVNSRKKGVTIFSGVEVDILKDGALDLKYSILRELDFVTGSIHSGLSQSRERATERILAAMQTGVVDMIGHLTGRLIGERAGYEVDVEKIIEEAARHNVVLELNAHPKRLDIDDRTCRMAKAGGVKVAIATDMHHIDDLNNLHFGIGVARRGWLESEDVINTWGTERLIDFLKSRRP